MSEEINNPITFGPDGQAYITVELATEKLNEMVQLTISSAGLRFATSGHNIVESRAFVQGVQDDLKEFMEATNERVENLVKAQGGTDALELLSQLGSVAKAESFGTYL